MQTYKFKKLNGVSKYSPTFYPHMFSANSHFVTSFKCFYYFGVCVCTVCMYTEARGCQRTFFLLDLSSYTQAGTHLSTELTDSLAELAMGILSLPLMIVLTNGLLHFCSTFVGAGDLNKGKNLIHGVILLVPALCLLCRIRRITRNCPWLLQSFKDGEFRGGLYSSEF